MLEGLFPHRCEICGKPASWGRPVLCHECLHPLRLQAQGFCKRCGRVMPSPWMTQCVTCEAPDNLRRTLFLYPYQGNVREVIHQYKFRRQREYAPLLASLLVEQIPWLSLYDAIVPVPSQKPFFHRYPTFMDIAPLLARKYDLPVLCCLRKKKGTQQKKLSKNRRLTQEKGIYYQEKSPFIPKYALLMDDIFTSGATVTQCLEILYEQGWKRLDVITLCRS